MSCWCRVDHATVASVGPKTGGAQPVAAIKSMVHEPNILVSKPPSSPFITFPAFSTTAAVPGEPPGQNPSLRILRGAVLAHCASLSPTSGHHKAAVEAFGHAGSRPGPLPPHCPPAVPGTP